MSASKGSSKKSVTSKEYWLEVAAGWAWWMFGLHTRISDFHKAKARRFYDRFCRWKRAAK